MMKQVIGAVAMLGAFVATNGAFAQGASENQVAAKTDWSVFVEDDPKECWAVSAPKETVNTKGGRVVSVRRSDILLMAFFRPGAGVSGQLTFTGGYPFRKDGSVNLNIDGTEFELYPEGEWAWAASPGEDANILASMKRGSSAVLTAMSARGTVTKDTFSLLGFTAALDEAEARCK